MLGEPVGNPSRGWVSQVADMLGEPAMPVDHDRLHTIVTTHYVPRGSLDGERKSEWYSQMDKDRVCFKHVFSKHLFSNVWPLELKVGNVCAQDRVLRVEISTGTNSEVIL